MTNANWKNTLKKGDNVIISYRSRISLGVVERLTKTQIILTNKSKYRISNGNLVGGNYWSTEKIEKCTDARLKEMQELIKRSRLIKLIESKSLKNLSTDQLENIYHIIS